MAAWIRPVASANANRMIINKEGEYEVAIDNNNQIMWAVANTSPGWVWHTTGIYAPNDTWSHVVFTYDGTRAKTYLNGELVEDIAASGVIGDAHAGLNELRIGGRSNVPAGKYFAGTIDEVRAYPLRHQRHTRERTLWTAGSLEVLRGQRHHRRRQLRTRQLCQFRCRRYLDQRLQRNQRAANRRRRRRCADGLRVQAPTEGTLAFWMRSSGSPASNKQVIGTGKCLGSAAPFHRNAGLRSWRRRGRHVRHHHAAERGRPLVSRRRHVQRSEQ